MCQSLLSKSVSYFTVPPRAHSSRVLRRGRRGLGAGSRAGLANASLAIRSSFEDRIVPRLVAVCLHSDDDSRLRIVRAGARGRAVVSIASNKQFVKENKLHISNDVQLSPAPRCVEPPDS